MSDTLELAPDFTLPVHGGDQGDVSLKGLHGTPFVLFFYPRDDTSGCTLSDSHILVDFLPHIPCELSAVLDGLEIGPA